MCTRQKVSHDMCIDLILRYGPIYTVVRKKKRHKFYTKIRNIGLNRGQPQTIYFWSMIQLNVSTRTDKRAYTLFLVFGGRLRCVLCRSSLFCAIRNSSTLVKRVHSLEFLHPYYQWSSTSVLFTISP